MARPFNLRDLALIHRLGERGVMLHAETALTKRWQPLWGALHSLFSGGDELTLVWRDERGPGAGFVQLQITEDNSNARLIYLGATTLENGHGNGPVQSIVFDTGDLDVDAWLALLDGVVAEAGRRGVHSLVAEADESGPELVVLRRAGFAVYTRQDVWVLDDVPVLEAKQQILQPYNPEDDWEMALLYTHIVPPLIQMVEPNPPDDGVLWILRMSDGELMAFVHVHDGPGASWLRFFIHPNAQEMVGDIVMAALHLATPGEDHPVYCCVRRYQSWLQQTLAATGFRLWGSQAVMVKHTVHPIRQHQPSLSAALNAQGVTTPPTPFSRIPKRPVMRQRVEYLKEQNRETEAGLACDMVGMHERYERC